MSEFNYDKVFIDYINRHCDLPNIDKQDAYDLYYAALELVGALATLRRLIPQYGSRELQRLVRAVGKPTGQGDLAAAIVRFVANVWQPHAQVS